MREVEMAMKLGKETTETKIDCLFVLVAVDLVCECTFVPETMVPLTVYVNSSLFISLLEKKDSK